MLKCKKEFTMKYIKKTIGQKIIDTIINGKLVYVDTPQNAVLVWSANADSQLTALVDAEIARATITELGKDL